MDRRKSLQTIILGAGAAAVSFHSCRPESTQETTPVESTYFGRTPEELKRLEQLQSEQLFNAHEMETIAALSTVILPPKEPHGGPIEAEVPEFIEFMGKDIPELQMTLLGGLMWIDHRSNTDYGVDFKKASLEQQKEICDQICWHSPDIALDDQALEIQFFAVMRNLVVCGYYTSKVGIADLGYQGNVPNVWDGVPQEVLEQHGVDYEPEWLAKCVDQSKRNEIAQWDEKGNLLT